MMASHGLNVVGTDYDEERVASLNNGTITFQEKGLDELYAKSCALGIEFSTVYQETDLYIVSVPTPYDPLSKQVDPSYIVTAVEEILSVCQPESTIVIESTVSPGTIDRYIRPIVDMKSSKQEMTIHLVHAPERIIPGNMVHELIHNNRTIGADDCAIGERIKQLYEQFCEGEIIVTDIRTAEMTKVVENTYRAVNIGFANELAKICRQSGMDVYEIIRICNQHPRVNILKPGPGVGGHCIPVDPWFLVGDYPGLTDIISASMKTNDEMPAYVLRRIHDIMEENGMTDPSLVGLYGLTYKENVDDCRESPTLQLLERLKKNLAAPLRVYDPFVKRDLVDHQYHDFEAFLEDTDFVVIMVAHRQLLDNMDRLKDKIVLDTRGVCELDGVYRL
jgi:UDP-N-acetyl-D-mannosaminuronic acid dehydrogenase